jgi:glycosyltransferase involved in cell wall biosynthesis
MPPKISVLVPVLNGGEFLSECLESILAQDFPDYELLVSDDGSTDDTGAIIERFATRDSRIRWWRNPVNLGMAANFNRCLQSAQGDYVKYVMHDDKLTVPTALRRMAEMLDQYPSVSLVGSATQLLDAKSSPLGVRNPFLRTGLCPGRQVILKCLTEGGNSIGEPSTVMFRRTQAARGFNQQFHMIIDLEMWIHFLEQGDFAYLAEPLSAFRSHPGQFSETGRRTSRHQLEYPQLLAACLAKPWFGREFPKTALFANIHGMRKWKYPGQAAFASELLKRLDTRWYFLYWLHHKLTRPWKKWVRRTWPICHPPDDGGEVP